MAARGIVITAKGRAILRLLDAGLYTPLPTREARSRNGRRQARINHAKRTKK